MLPTIQSAYHQFYSTETVVTKLLNDLRMEDLTGAFDTVDHKLLLLQLERQFGIHGNLFLQWLVVTILWQGFFLFVSRPISLYVSLNQHAVQKLKQNVNFNILSYGALHF